MSMPRQKSQVRQSGQAMAEFALVMPVLVLIFFGLAFAGWYGYRSAASDWGVFISGVARGSYNTPADPNASILWSDIRSSISVGEDLSHRMVHSRIDIARSRNWLYGIVLNETQKGRTYFRLWRFYPGPPPSGGYE